MKRARFLIATMASVIALTTLAAVPALAHSSGTTYTKIATIVPPGVALKSFDISFVDESSQRYYLADRSNAGVDIIDATTNMFLGRLSGFAGPSTSNDTAGPNGVLVIHPLHELWAGDGDSTVKVFDLDTFDLVATIKTGGTKRADEMAFDQKDDLFVVANDADDVPFVTFIDARSKKVVGHISFPDATNGLEQSVWDPETHLFYLSIPQVGSDPLNGAIAVMDPRSLSLVAMFPVKNCQPAGLALGFMQQLLLGCSGDAIDAGARAQTQIMDARTGGIVTTILNVGGADEVWYNSGDKRWYVAARKMTSTGFAGGTPTPVLGVIDAVTDTWLVNVPTGTQAHSVAADPINDHVFVPVSGKGIFVFAHN